MPSGAFDWQPYGPYLAESRVARFMAAHNIATWRELIDRSTQDIDWFWPAALDFLGVEWVQPYHRLYDDSLGL
ncbi:MAG TPA: AMP-dependent synthetase, partial [Dehalococcoidia bacterium]|nr:AMP-dependent synthetase [Dehalococcoidia bacterium]